MRCTRARCFEASVTQRAYDNLRGFGQEVNALQFAAQGHTALRQRVKMSIG